MNSRFFAALMSVVIMFSSLCLQAKIETTSGDFNYQFFGTLKEETVAAKNIALLNNNNEGNKTWYARHTLDLNLDVNYGQKTYDKKVAEALLNIRNKGVWGNPESIASTTETELKILDAQLGRHRHAIPVHILWIRQIWLDFSINAILGLPFIFNHGFKFGLFPFQVGRGIALGDAYAVGPRILGFYNDDVVDQFAPGGLLYGDILEDRLSYNLYAGILQNKSTSLAETGEAIFGQSYGRLKNPQRGSGSINFVIAGKLNWTVFDTVKLGKLAVEPYALYNRDPEQMIEFRGDSINQLGTIGVAAEYTYPRFEIGFDYALNLGQQRVKGWDRNQVQLDNRNGQAVIVNSHVLDQNKNKIPFIKGSSAQKIIECSYQDESQNGQVIGTVDGVGYLSGTVNLTNGGTRFRDPYTNKYEGWMFVIDGLYNVIRQDLKLAATAGIATGDDNPNNETIDGIYSGFIPLQEAYYGKRVKSAFLLGGAGKLRRPLSNPTEQSPFRFAPSINGFTNLVFCGFGLKWEPSDWPKRFMINPNILPFWEEKPIKKFDALTRQELDVPASTFLGTELNLFIDYWVLKDLKLTFVGSIFFPGQHYTDIQGKPLDATQKLLLDRLDPTGFEEDRIPNLGDDPAYTLNVSLEFKF